MSKRKSDSEKFDKKLYQSNKEEWQEKVINLVKEEMETWEEIKKCRVSYNPESVNRFVDHYADKQMSAIKHGFEKNMNKEYDEEEEDDLDLMDNAFFHLGIIQQKKLFDLQLQWRAKLIDLPDVNIVFDFDIISKDILNSKILTPISIEEFNLYIDFLESCLYNDDEYQLDSHFYFQDYRELKGWKDVSDEEDEDDDEFEEWDYLPDWYIYHNTQTGNDKYLILPDIKGKKEMFYRSRRTPEETEKIEKEKIENPTKPWMNVFKDELIEKLFHKYESAKSIKAFKTYNYDLDYYENLDNLEEMTSILLKAKEKIPIPACEDWLVGIKKAFRNYQIKQLIVAMKDAYKQYQMNISLNIAFYYDDSHSMAYLRETYYQQIFNGRRLEGEPENFDY